jgi:hypothetical protein
LSRRVSLPGAEELFRRTGQAAEMADPTTDTRQPTTRANGDPRHPSVPSPRRSSGRIKHDEKMTVYVTADELLDLEHARLRLRREWGVGVDRGRVVREAIAIVLADMEARGADSELVRRLTGS